MKRLLTLVASLTLCTQVFCQEQFQIQVGDNQAFWYSIINDSDTDPVVALSRFAYKGNNCEFISVSPTVTYKGKEYKVTSIGADVFANVGMVSIDLPNTVTKIGDEAFSYCEKLKSIDLSNVESIGYCAFYNCTSLESVTTSSALKFFDEGAFYQCSGLLSIDLSNVENISYFSFGYCTSLESVKTGSALKTIEEYAFVGCSNLRFFDLSNVGTIGNYAFYDCTSLETVTLSNQNVGMYAFYNVSGLKTINLGKDSESLYKDCFSNTISLEAVNIESGNKNFISIDGVAYNPDTTKMLWFPAGKSLLTIETPTKTIDLENVKIAQNIDTIIVKEGNADFIYINGGLFTADTSKLIRLVANGDYELDGRIDSLFVSAFYGCKNLTSLKIPASVTYIENGVFSYCPNLEKIEVEASNPNFVTVDGVMFDSTKKKLLCYPAKRKGEYTIPETVETIGVSAFANCTELSYIKIPNNVSLIDKYAFKSCTGLKNVEFPQNIRGISTAAFANCTGLVSVVMPDTVKSMGQSLFEGCSNLKSVLLPIVFKGSSLSDYMFYGCTSLDSVVIPKCVKTIGMYAFYGCIGLTKIDIHNNLQSVSDYAFMNCQVLDSIFLPKTLSYVGEFAFANCLNLTIYSELESEPGYYVEYWNISGCPVVWGCAASNEGDDDNDDTAIFVDNAENVVNIYAFNNAIVVDNANADVFVYDVMGKLVAKDMSNDQRVEMHIQRAGVYIVKAGNATQRVVVR